MAPKILISKKVVQNGPLHCPKRPIIQPERPIAKSKTAHSDIQNGPLSLSAFGNVQSDLEILYVEASYTLVRGLDSETVKCSAMHYGVTCSKFKSVNGSTVCKIATQHFQHKSHTNLIINPTYHLWHSCRGATRSNQLQLPSICYRRSKLAIDAFPRKFHDD